MTSAGGHKILQFFKALCCDRVPTHFYEPLIYALAQSVSKCYLFRTNSFPKCQNDKRHRPSWKILSTSNCMPACACCFEKISQGGVSSCRGTASQPCSMATATRDERLDRARENNYRFVFLFSLALSCWRQHPAYFVPLLSRRRHHLCTDLMSL